VGAIIGCSVSYPEFNRSCLFRLDVVPCKYQNKLLRRAGEKYESRARIKLFQASLFKLYSWNLILPLHFIIHSCCYITCSQYSIHHTRLRESPSGFVECNVRAKFQDIADITRIGTDGSRFIYSPGFYIYTPPRYNNRCLLIKDYVVLTTVCICNLATRCTLRFYGNLITD
jgi:hypothetical protein